MCFRKNNKTSGQALCVMCSLLYCDVSSSSSANQKTITSHLPASVQRANIRTAAVSTTDLRKQSLTGTHKITQHYSFFPVNIALGFSLYSNKTWPRIFTQCKWDTILEEEIGSLISVRQPEFSTKQSDPGLL